MKKLTVLLLLVFGFISMNAQDTPIKKATRKAVKAVIQEVPAKKVYEVGPTTISVQDFQDKAESFVGKTIYITGIVDHVCKHGGKKVMLVSEDGEASIKIMAGDKISKFNKDIEGEKLKVLGVVKEMRMDDAFLSDREEKTKEHHKADDPEYKEDMKWIGEMRKKVKESKKGYLSFYSMDGINYKVIK